MLAAKLYHDAPGFDLLPWDPLIASVVYFGWGDGPGQAIDSLRGLIGVRATASRRRRSNRGACGTPSIG